MATFTWATPDAIATALSTDLNSLADGSYSAASSAINNETGLDLYLDLELVLASLTPTGQPYCAIFLLPTLDGTNYEDTPNASSMPIAIFSFSTATAAKRKMMSNILIPPLSFKLVVLNDMNVALAASGNTLKYRLHSESGT